MERNFKYLNEKYVKRKLLVFDDMQLDTKGNTGFFGLISPFNESAAQYYHERFMETLAARIIWKLRLLAEEKEIKEDNTELRYLIMN